MNGAFIGLHGSWNRKPLACYKVVFVKFNEKGHPQGLPIDLLTGFLTKEDEARGRPVDVLIDNAAALLVSDDVGGVIWRVSNPKSAAAKSAALECTERACSRSEERRVGKECVSYCRYSGSHSP